jgi:hypothetical protein
MCFIELLIRPAVALLGLAAVTVAQSASASWERHAFPMQESIWSVAALDANGDGKLDLVAMGVTKIVALLRPDWQPRELLDAKDGKMLHCVSLDVDRDGDADLVIGRYQIPWIEHRQAVAAGKLSPEPKGPDFSVAWLENTGRPGRWPLHVVDRELNGIHGLAVGDIDGDGRPDVVAGSINGPAFPNSIAWFSAPQRRGQTWLRHVVTRAGADGRPHYLDVGDVDGDGLNDILLGDSGGGTFTWWQRTTSSGEPWPKHVIARERGATNESIADMDGDGKRDVVASSGHGKGVFWFKSQSWTKHEIDAAIPTPHALAVGDFDRDGDVDVAAASYTAFIVRWYENDGAGRFTAREIDTENRQQAYDLKTADLDGDAALDLILAGRESRNVVWYRQRQ